MGLIIYNTLARGKEPFVPLQEGFVGMYVCGPTVYSHSHIGHAKSYVSFDVILRYLRMCGYKVLYVQNITDVGHLTDNADEGEDKLIKQARLDRVHPMQIAEAITRSYFADMDALGVLRPDISPRATGHITEQIEVIERIVKNGYAYEVDGSVYFDVRKFPGYGRLSGRSLQDSVQGTRVGARSDKRDPADFALWKRAEAGHIMRWPSPWGPGFPGWHIECSAMSMKYLGESFDIHGGGMDNQFPHHECEIAQSQCATGKPFVKYWIHNNLVTVNGQKMSKSLGNFVTLKDAFQRYDPIAVRFFILQSHYRSTLDFSEEALGGAKGGLEKLLNAVRRVREARGAAEANGGGTGSADAGPFRDRFREAMDDDFNAPQAIAVLFDFANEANRALDSAAGLTLESLRSIELAFDDLGGTVLGIIPKLIAAGGGGVETEQGLIALLLKVRAEVRSAKLWSLSDLVRDGLKALGIIVEDRKDGTLWRRSF